MAGGTAGETAGVKVHSTAGLMVVSKVVSMADMLAEMLVDAMAD